MTENLTIGRAINDLTARFRAAGIDSPRLDARLLVGHALGLEASMLFARTGDPLSPEQAEAIAKLGERRAAREPVSRIVGHREFWGLEFLLNAAALDPRPETEMLVTTALEMKDVLKNPRARILDLGTGSGCVLISILSSWPQATGVGIDISRDAVELARTNALRLGVSQRVQFREGHWCDGIMESFDLIVSNPPYVAESEAGTLAPEVALYDPARALFGGSDGLDAYRELIPAAEARLTAEGRLLLEIGAAQEKAVEKLLRDGGFIIENKVHDLAGIVRVLGARCG